MAHRLITSTSTQRELRSVDCNHHRGYASSSLCWDMAQDSLDDLNGVAIAISAPSDDLVWPNEHKRLAINCPELILFYIDDGKIHSGHSSGCNELGSWRGGGAKPQEGPFKPKSVEQ
nr:hypothetical protein [Rhizobium ruizarguesonis]